MNKILILALISVLLLGIADSRLSKRRLADDDSVETVTNNVVSTNSTTNETSTNESNSSTSNTESNANNGSNSSNAASNESESSSNNNGSTTNESSTNTSDNSTANESSVTPNNNATNVTNDNSTNNSAGNNNSENSSPANNSANNSNNTANNNSTTNNSSVTPNNTNNSATNNTTNNSAVTTNNTNSSATNNASNNNSTANNSAVTPNNTNNSAANNASNNNSATNNSAVTPNNSNNSASNNSSANNNNSANNTAPVVSNTTTNETNITTLSVVASVSETTKLANIVVTCSQKPTAVYVAAALVNDVRLNLLPYEVVVNSLGNSTVFTDKASYRVYAASKNVAATQATFELNLKNSGESYQAIGFCVNGNQSSSNITSSWVQPDNGGKTGLVSLTFSKILTDLEVNKQAASLADVLAVDKNLVYDNFGNKIPTNTPTKRALANETVAPVVNNSTVANSSNTTYVYNTYIQRDYFNKEDKVFQTVQDLFTEEKKTATLLKINEKLTALNIANASGVVVSEFKPKQPVITKPVANVFDATSVNVTVSRSDEGRIYIVGGNTDENTSLNTWSNWTVLAGTDIKGNKYSVNNNAYLRSNETHVFTFTNLTSNSKYSFIVLATSDGIATDGLFDHAIVEVVTGSSFGNKLGMGLLAIAFTIFALLF